MTATNDIGPRFGEVRERGFLPQSVPVRSSRTKHNFYFQMRTVTRTPVLSGLEAQIVLDRLIQHHVTGQVVIEPATGGAQPFDTDAGSSPTSFETVTMPVIDRPLQVNRSSVVEAQAGPGHVCFGRAHTLFGQDPQSNSRRARQ